MFKEIQRLVKQLPIPGELDKADFHANEEAVFLRQYDIQTYAMSNIKEVREMWHYKECMRHAARVPEAE